jgi:hypothetical protein
MGLDVRVYKDIKLTKDDDFEFIAFVPHEPWEYKIKNLVKNGHYIGQSDGPLISYSYSTHNRFRECLMKVIGRDDLLNEKGKIKWSELTNNISFYEFINFSDCEGCLDWEISEKIYLDFYKFNVNAKIILEPYYYEKYLKWLHVFESAKDNGVVVFY